MSGLFMVINGSLNMDVRKNSCKKRNISAFAIKTNLIAVCIPSTQTWYEFYGKLLSYFFDYNLWLAS